MKVADLPPQGFAEPVSRSLWETWRLALTRPNEVTYQSMADDPRASVGLASGWTALAAVATTIISLVGQWLYGGLAQALSVLQENVPAGDLAVFSSAGLALVVCMLPVTVAASVAGLLIYAGILQFVTDAFGGQGTFAKMTFTLAAFSAPLSIVTGLLTLLPLVGACLSVPVGIYGIALDLLAVKAVSRLSWGRTIASVVLILVLAALAALVFVLLAWRAMPLDRLPSLYQA